MERIWHDQASNLRQQLELASEVKSNLRYKTLWTGAGSSLLLLMLEKLLLVSFDSSNNTDAIDVKMDGSVLEEKLSFKMLGFSS